MNRELNTKAEMMKRLAYSVYVGCLFFASVLAIRGIAAEQTDEILASILLGVIAYHLRRTGIRRLEFRRLARSFPMGSREDRLSGKTREEMTQLFDAFHRTEDWIERQEIRRSLECAVERQPRLVEVYYRDLLAVHPTLCHRADPSDKQRQ